MIWLIQSLPICIIFVSYCVNRHLGDASPGTMMGFISWFHPQHMESFYQGLEVLIKCRMIGIHLLDQKQKLHHALSCLTLNWKSNLYGYQKNLYQSAIGVNIHYQMCLPMITRTAQVIWEASISDADWLIGQVLVEGNNSLPEMGYTPIVCNMLGYHMEYSGWLTTLNFNYIFQWYHMWVLRNPGRSYIQGPFLELPCKTPYKNNACMTVIWEVIHMYEIGPKNFLI